MAQESRKFQESFRALTQIDEVLQGDASLALRHFHDAVARFNSEPSSEHGEASDFFAKACIRAFLGRVDGVAYALRRFVIDCADEAGLSIPPKRLAQLMERRYDPKSGTITTDENRLSTPLGLKVAVTWFPKLVGADFRLDTDGEGWRGLQRIITVRNQFTHPKRLEHLFPQAAFAAIHPTFMWFLVQMRDMFAACADKLGMPLPRHAELVLEFPYKETDHPIHTIMSDQDTEAIVSVAARTYKYVEFMVKRSTSDLRRAFELIRSSQPLFGPCHQYAVRTGVRTLFSEVEARTGAAVFFVEAAEKRGEIKLFESDRQSLAAREVENQMVAALTIFSREFGNDYVPEATGELWNEFRGARLFRDRLTHPKNAQSFKVDAKALMTFFKAAQYFANTWDALAINVEKCLLKPNTPVAPTSEER